MISMTGPWLVSTKAPAVHSDYDSIVYNNPINLLRAIKEHSLNYQESPATLPLDPRSMSAPRWRDETEEAWYVILPVAMLVSMM
jgi:hypothetical protein